MPIFQYRARDEAGRLITGEMESKSSILVNASLRGKDLYPVDIKQKPVGKDISLQKFGSRVEIKDIAVFCRQFAALNHAGVPVPACLDILREQTENKRLRGALAGMHENVQKGKSLSDTMLKYTEIFPQLLISMVEAGETSGTLDTVMGKMAEHFETQNGIDQKIKSALTYPAVVACVAVGVVIFLVSFVLPTFIGLFRSAGVELPVPTKILIGFSGLIRNYWYIFLMAFAASYALYKFYITSSEGRKRVDGLKLSLPVIGTLNRQIVTARFTRTLGILIRSGVPLLRSMEITDKVIGNRTVSEAISDISAALAEGSGLAAPMRSSGLFPPVVYQMVEVGESSGTLDDMLLNAADFFDREVETAAARLTSMIEPALTLFMAGIIGFIVISIALPMFRMMNLVGY